MIFFLFCFVLFVVKTCQNSKEIGKKNISKYIKSNQKAKQESSLHGKQKKKSELKNCEGKQVISQQPLNPANHRCL